MSITIKQLAEICNARIEGGDPNAVLESAADISSASVAQVTQLTNPRYSQYLQDCAASACFISETFARENAPPTLALLICTDPELGFIKALDILYPERSYATLIAPEAVVADTLKVGKNVYIGPFAVIGDQVEVGDGTRILAGACVGSRVKIGKNCRIHPYAVIYDNVIIGDEVIIHAGAVIGADGFGYKFREHQHIKVPQVGHVVIGDQCEIGANTCIDRGALGATTIGRGSKIDNLVQIGHNNKIGRHVIICGQVGVSGSCQIEDYAILAGSAGIADHVTIGQGAVVMARAGVAANVEAGTHIFGSPAKEKRLAFKEQAALSKLPALLKKVKELEDKIQLIENK